ncbi:MAG: hypothetical protein M3P14_03330 [Chloroflexota bacterium]|nr:hypothetical protein [Chloroflexota bacterium]
MTAIVLASFASGAAAATTTVECGLFRNYTAPDPVAVTAGSITFGLHGTPEAIAPDATLVPPADSLLASLQGGTPTCLAVVRDAGNITSLAFAPSGTISGTVVLVADLFGPGQDAYVIADRVVTPVAAVTANPGLAALIKTAADSGSIFSVTFQIDLSSGVPTSFAATTTLSGLVSLGAGGDVHVGAATLPNAVIDATSRAKLTAAASLGVPATVVVNGAGTLAQGGQGGVAIQVTLSVTYTAPVRSMAPATPADLPNTAVTTTSSRDERTSFGLAVVFLAILTAGGVRLLARRARL